MRVSKSIDEIDPKKFRHMQNSAQFKEILKDINVLRTKKKACKNIMNLCDSI